MWVCESQGESFGDNVQVWQKATKETCSSRR